MPGTLGVTLHVLFYLSNSFLRYHSLQPCLIRVLRFKEDSLHCKQVTKGVPRAQLYDSKIQILLWEHAASTLLTKTEKHYQQRDCISLEETVVQEAGKRKVRAQFDSREDLSDRLSWACTTVFLSGTKTNLWWMSLFLIILNLLIGVFAFGLFATDIFVNAGQVVTGHLTPYFLTVCKPNYTSTDCRAHHQFINNRDICTGDLEVIEKARRSFPSKHAALSIYSALYATVSMTWEEFGLWWVSLLSSSPILSLQSLLVASEVMLQCVSLPLYHAVAPTLNTPV